MAWDNGLQSIYSPIFNATYDIQNGCFESRQTDPQVKPTQSVFFCSRTSTHLATHTRSLAETYSILVPVISATTSISFLNISRRSKISYPLVVRSADEPASPELKQTPLVFAQFVDGFFDFRRRSEHLRRASSEMTKRTAQRW